MARRAWRVSDSVFGEHWRGGSRILCFLYRELQFLLAPLRLCFSLLPFLVPSVAPRNHQHSDEHANSIKSHLRY